MPLPDTFAYLVGTQFVFCDSTGDFGPAAGTDLRQASPTSVLIKVASVANNAARQSDKVDLGANRPEAYDVIAALEFAATPVAGSLVELYWAPSPDPTAGNGNPGGVTGADAAYAGYSSNLDASLPQLQFIGDFVVTAQATGTVQVARVGTLIPRYRYGTLVVVNRSGAAMHSDDVECHVVFEPQVFQVQD